MQLATRYCERCGVANRSDARFCFSCGHPQTAPLTGTQRLPVSVLTNDQKLRQRYHILAKVGEGGFGAVYKAEDRHFNNATRAIKEMSQHRLKPQELQRAVNTFMQEVMLLASLMHPSLPRIYDHFEEGGHWYLVMDFIEGETLEERAIRSPGGKLSLKEVLSFGIQLSNVLQYLHTRPTPIIFRDLKPSNVMITADNHIYLIDFGLARLFKPDQTKDTEVLGTHGYAAPEQYGRVQTTARSDIYSLGATIHYLLTGRDPSRSPFVFSSLGFKPQTPATKALEHLLGRMVEIKAHERPKDMQTVKQELQRISLLTQTEAYSTPMTALPISSSPASNDMRVITAQMPAFQRSSEPALIVSANGDGHYKTLSEALQNAPVNGRIVVRTGIYNESLVIDKPVEIVGEGPYERIILEHGADRNCLRMLAEQAIVKGLTIRGRANPYSTQQTSYAAIDIARGQLVLENCDISSVAAASIVIHNAQANPIIRQCRIGNGRDAGIIIYDQGRGEIIDCEIFAHAYPNIVIKKGGNPLIRRCRIYEGNAIGIYIDDQGQGVVEDCEIFAHVVSEVVIKQGSNPTFRRCHIHDGQSCGIYVLEQGAGTFEDCEIFSNASSGVAVTSQGQPTFKRCTFRQNKNHGVIIYDGGHGLFEECESFEHSTNYSEIAIVASGDPTFRRCKFHHGQSNAVLICEQGLGTFEDCEIFSCAQAGIEVKSKGQPTFRRCSFYDGKTNGIMVHSEGEGIFEDCEVFANASAEVVVATGGNPILRSCSLYGGRSSGVFIYDGGRGTFESCEIFSHTAVYPEVIIKSAGNPVFRLCKLYGSKSAGIMVHGEGQGIFEQCEIYENAHDGITIKTGGNPTIRNCKIYNNARKGLHVYSKGRGIIEHCLFRGNVEVPWDVDPHGDTILRSNKAI